MKCIVCGALAIYTTLDRSRVIVGVCERDKKYVGQTHVRIEGS